MTSCRTPLLLSPLKAESPCTVTQRARPFLSGRVLLRSALQAPKPRRGSGRSPFSQASAGPVWDVANLHRVFAAKLRIEFGELR